jgi:hypothetical protein
LRISLFNKGEREMKQQRWLSFWSMLLIAALLAACAGAAPAQPAAQPAQEQAAPAAASETGAAADKVFRLGHDIVFPPGMPIRTAECCYGFYSLVMKACG